MAAENTFRFSNLKLTPNGRLEKDLWGIAINTLAIALKRLNKEFMLILDVFIELGLPLFQIRIVSSKIRHSFINAAEFLLVYLKEKHGMKLRDIFEIIELQRLAPCMQDLMLDYDKSVKICNEEWKGTIDRADDVIRKNACNCSECAEQRDYVNGDI